MNNKFKKIIYNILPENLIKKISHKFQYYSFRGNYKNFNELEKFQTNYDNKKIIRKTLKAFLISRKDSKIIDRDGEIVYKKNNNFKLLTCINNILKQEKNFIIDFGGSLSNFYRTNKNFLNKRKTHWLVLDNREICKLGKKYFKFSNVNFFYNEKDLLFYIYKNKIKINLIIFSSSLQYINNFEEILRSLMKTNCKNIIIERQPILKTGITKYCLQRVPFWNGNYSFAVKLYNYFHLVSILNKYNFFLKKKISALGDDFLNGEYKTLIFQKII